MKDINGCENTISKPDFITIDQPSLTNLAFTASPTFGCDPPLNVTFTNTSTGNGLTYLWNFGDGQTSTAPNPLHTLF